MAFALFSVIPAVKRLIFDELLVTNLVGVLFWVGFQEAAHSGSFTPPCAPWAASGTRPRPC